MTSARSWTSPPRTRCCSAGPRSAVCGDSTGAGTSPGRHRCRPRRPGAYRSLDRAPYGRHHPLHLPPLDAAAAPRNPADAPDWPRRLALLVALAGQGTEDLPVGAAVTRLLPSARLPAPFLDAIRELRYEEAEETVLAILPEAPAAALDTLEAIGGPRTVAVLTEALGPDTDGRGIAPFLRPVRHRALELLWQLQTDPELRRHLLARVGPTALPPAVAADLGAPDERELALLTAGPEPGDPVAALCALAAHDSTATLPAVTGLLLRVVGELAASWDTVETDPEAARAEEPVVPQEIVDAVRALGGRLYGRRRIRPVCLLGARDAQEAGTRCWRVRYSTCWTGPVFRPVSSRSSSRSSGAHRPPTPAPACTGCCATATRTYANT